MHDNLLLIIIQISQMNYHFKNYPHQQQLLKELQQIDKELQRDKKVYDDKQRKLQSEFYQDNHQPYTNQPKIQLADEIMNQLLINKSSKPLQPQRQFQKPCQDRIVAKSPEREGQFVNQRELQKKKLQQKNAYGDYPFGAASSKEKPRVEHSPPQKALVENKNKRSVEKRQVYENEKNPFLSNEQKLKAKREEEERRYRELLQQQMEEKRKQKEKQKIELKRIQEKEEKEVKEYYKKENNRSSQNYLPPSPKVKKRDPNGKPPEYNKPKGNQYLKESDYEFMKLQVQDLKTKMNRGRISYEEFERQKEKLERFYKIPIDFDQEEKKPEQELQPSRFIEEHHEQIHQTQIKLKPVPEQYQQPQYPQYQQMQQMQSRPMSPQYMDPKSQMMNPSMNSVHSVPYQFQMQSNMSGQQNEFQMQLMNKLFDELKEMREMYRNNMISEKKMMQETLSRMNNMMFNPQLLTQQIPSSQMPQREFFSDVKQYEQRQKSRQKYRSKSKSKQKYKVQSSESSHINSQQKNQSDFSLSCVQKSLSGIVKKIPLTEKQRELQINEETELDRFYLKKYKVKRFKEFDYIEEVNRSNTQLPGVSNFLSTKNANQEVGKEFQRDLILYKDVQLKKQMNRMREIVQTNSKYSESLAKSKANDNYPQLQSKKKESQKKKLQDQNSFPDNPFLKKHISSQSYHPPTFHQNDFKEYKTPSEVRSPEHQSSSQILEQEEYQTEPKKQQSPDYSEKKKRFKKVKKEQKKVEQKKEEKVRAHPSTKILNVIKSNNEILSKYDQTPSKISDSSIKESVRVIESSKQYESNVYFSGHDISPVQRKQYQSSLQTVRSQEESAKVQRRNNMNLFLMGSEEKNQFKSSSAFIETQKKEQKQESLSKSPSLQHNLAAYSQTVESVQESSTKFANLHKPPISKKNGRSVSRKKQSVIRISNESMNRSNFIKEEVIKMEDIQIPPYYEKKDESLSINESEYFSRGEKSKLIMQEFEEKEQERNEAMEIKLQEQNSFQKEKVEDEKVKANEESPEEKKEIGPKWKSLDEARKIAKQLKQKWGEDQNKSSVEEKLSELESFFHFSKKQDSSLVSVKPKEEKKKKNIMKMLDELGDEQEYQPDFQSYREESER